MTALSFEGALEKYLNTIEKYHDSFEYRENESENVFKLINKKTC
jgi:FMN-dependent NADH-azoreductase